ncbi:hypothetical protein SAMN05443377_1043 [Propionibacterium cyclohexanicum]|uniref:BFN domain-containing protein n=1 Tax=Propionibacterium cyclohexanicum TaxID=64702 RepID=A0A1H9QN89_9ACTN|nr:bifunctional nuclease domain-containing protein [Propionibacterium cyclohexanicum]SER61665.1 hypothetical protein SAMN05443377_1043 [Propionibacterium cyclohexanicum]
MAELEVAGVRIMESADQPVLLLREKGTTRLIPVWVDAVTAATVLGISEQDNGGAAPSFRLFAEIVEALHPHDISAEITGWREGVFSARILVDADEIEGRLSDIVALSIVLDFPVECPDELVSELGVEAVDGDADVVEEFKSFLDQVDPGDFEP